MLRFQARWRRSWSAPVPPVRPWVTVKPRARLIVAFRPSMVSAWPRFSIRRRLAYSGELAMRSMRALSAMSMAMMSAAVAMSASGSWASSMMRRAIPGGEGRLRQSARAAVSSGGMSGRSIPLGQEYLGMHHSPRFSFLLNDCGFPAPSIGLIRAQRKVPVRTNAHSTGGPWVDPWAHAKSRGFAAPSVASQPEGWNQTCIALATSAA